MPNSQELETRIIGILSNSRNMPIKPVPAQRSGQERPFILASMNEPAFPNRPPLLEQPLFKGLMLSAGLHLAILALVHPVQLPPSEQTFVINARLVSPTPRPDAPASQNEAKAPALTDPVPTQAVPKPGPRAPEALTLGRPSPIQMAAAEKPPVELPPPTRSENPAKAIAALPAPGPASEPSPPVNKPTPAAPVLAVPLSVDTNWYVAREVDRHPKAVGSISPKYPEQARQRGQEGTLKLKVKIDDLGQVRDVEVVDAHPPGVFDEAALEAFRDARFQPAMKNGRPVRYEAYMRVEFKLD